MTKKATWPLAIKLTIAMTTMIAVAVVCITLLSIRREQDTFRTGLEQQADVLLDSLSAAGADVLYRLQLSSLRNLMGGLATTKAITGGWVYDAQGHVVADTVSPNANSAGEVDPFGSRVLNSQNSVFDWQADHLVAGKAVVLGRQTIGAFGVSLSTAPLEVKMTALRNEGLLVALLASIIGIVVSVFLSRSLTQPLRLLTTATERIAAGDFSQTIAVYSNDEVAVLTNAFNSMVTQLRETIQGMQQRTDELRRSETELRKSKEAAEAASRAKSAFLASMSHELRTPLNAILGFASVLSLGMLKNVAPLAPSQVELLQKIEINGRHLRDLINDVLDLAKIEAGRMTTVVTEDRPRVFLENTISAMHSLALQKNLDLSITFAPDVPEVVLCDVRKLQQILTNLVGNAIKFTSKGGVQIEVSAPTPELWQITVRDSGIGMPADASRYIFEKFQQVDGTDHREYEGTGLGLAIVKGLVETLDGTIAVESELGRGSTFIVTLPQRPVRKAA